MTRPPRTADRVPGLRLKARCPAPAQQRRQSKIVKAGRDQTDFVYIFWNVATSENHGLVIHGKYAFDRLELLKLYDLGPVQLDRFVGGCFARDGQADNAVRGRVGVRVKQCRVDNAEYCCGRTDCQGQRDYQP